MGKNTLSFANDLARATGCLRLLQGQETGRYHHELKQPTSPQPRRLQQTFLFGTCSWRLLSSFVPLNSQRNNFMDIRSTTFTLSWISLSGPNVPPLFGLHSISSAPLLLLLKLIKHEESCNQEWRRSRQNKAKHIPETHRKPCKARMALLNALQQSQPLPLNGQAALWLWMIRLLCYQ